MDSLELGPIFRALLRNKTRAAVILLELALTLAIVANCVAFILESRKNMRRPSGFDDDNLISIQTRLTDPSFKPDAQLDRAREEDLATLRAIPGVVAVTNTRLMPWIGGGSSTEVRPAGSHGPFLRTQIYGADEATFDTLGIHVDEGHGFTAQAVREDVLRSRAVFSKPRELGPDGTPKEKTSQSVVLSRAFAKLAFGSESPLGKVLEDSDGDRYPVVGVLDAFYNPYPWPIGEYGTFFMGYARNFDFGAGYLVRAQPGSAQEVAARAEAALGALRPLRTPKVQPIPDLKVQFFARDKLVVTLMGGVALLMVLVTGLGVVGLTTFSVTERTRQIGTRRALGATRSAVVRHFLVESALIILCATTLGTAFAYAINLALVSLTQAPKLNVGTLATGAAVLWIAGLLATFLPALRASRIAPVVATRTV